MNRMEIGTDPGAVNSDVDRVVNDLTIGQRKSFSYSRLLRYLCDPRPMNLCLEADVAHALEKQLGRNPEVDYAPGAMYVPLSLLPTAKRGGLDSKSGSAGGLTMATNVTDVLELLAEASLVIRLGAQLTNFSQTTALPVLASGVSSTWVAENPGADLSDSNPVYSQRALIPKSLMGTVTLSKTLTQQTNDAAERVIRAELARSAAASIDIAAVNGSGVGNEPVGLLQQDIAVVSIGANGGKPDFSRILELEYQATLAKPEEESSFGYLSTVGIRKLLRNTPETTSGQVMIWRSAPWGMGAQQVNGYPAVASSRAPSTLSKGSTSGSAHAILFGRWSELIVNQFGLMTLLADPYKQKKQGLIQVTSFMEADVIARHAGSFSCVKDATLT